MTVLTLIERYRIIKRRLAWTIGQWVVDDEESVKLPVVWQILLQLLSERSDSSDMAVRLSAANAIKAAVDVSRLESRGTECTDERVWDMDIAYFLPYLEQTASELYVLGKDTS